MKPIVFMTMTLVSLLSLMPAANAKDYTIHMVTHTDKGSYAFEPNKLTIKSGDTVTWENAQDDTHNVMSESVPKDAKSFESPMLEKRGQKWSYTFTESGTYAFHCHPHAGSGMRGEIIVDRPSSQAETQGSTQHDHAAHNHNDTSLTEKQALELLQAGKPVYSCTMDAHVFSSDKDGKCPICKMNLTQVTAIKDGKATFGDNKGTSMPMEMK